jgi:fructosamine-3-kinase
MTWKYIRGVMLEISTKQVQWQSSGSGERFGVYQGVKGHFFIKAFESLARYQAESSGLQAWDRQASAIRTPFVEKCDERLWIVLDYIEGGWEFAIAEDWFQFGAQLAKHHQKLGPNIGWGRDNYIGLGEQPNISLCVSKAHWIDFFRDYRLRPMWSLAVNRVDFQKETKQDFEQICQCLDSFYKDLTEVPISLVHGDLWGGNILFNQEKNRFMVIDPAVYWGHYEVDLAMSELFGSLNQHFYQGFQSVIAVPDHYFLRKKIYNLYHLLNHLNLFGLSYKPQVLTYIQELSFALK